MFILEMLFAFLLGVALTLCLMFIWALGQDSDAQAELREMQRALREAQNDH